MSTNQRKQLNPIQPKGKNTGSKETGRSVKKEDLKNLQKIDEKFEQFYKEEGKNGVKDILDKNGKKVISKQKDLDNLQKIDKKLKQDDELNEQAEKDCREAKNVITIRGRGPQLIKSKKNDIYKQQQMMNNLNALEQQEQWLKKNKGFMERQEIESKVKNKNIFVKQNLEVLTKDGIRWKGPIGNFKDMEKLKNKNNQERIEVVEKLSKSLHELYNICTNNNIPITSIDSTYISIIVKILGNDDLKMQNDIKNIIKGVPLCRYNNCDHDNNKGFQVQFAKLIKRLTEYFTEYLNEKYSQQNAGLNKDDKNNNVANINNNNENDIDVHFNDNTYKQSDEDSKEEEKISKVNLPINSSLASNDNNSIKISQEEGKKLKRSHSSSIQKASEDISICYNNIRDSQNEDIENKKDSNEESINEWSINSANNQHKRLDRQSLDNIIESNNRPNSANNNKKPNIDDIMQLNDNPQEQNNECNNDNNIKIFQEENKINQEDDNNKPIKEALMQPDIKKQRKLGNTIKQNNKQINKMDTRFATHSANNQHKRLDRQSLDNIIESNNRPNSANNKETNIDNIMQQYNNVGNVGNANVQPTISDEVYCKNVIDDVTNKGNLSEGTDLQRFINCYRRNNNILTHKSAIFWLNAEERRNNALLDFINNDARDNNLENLKTLNDRLKNIRGGKCSWCGGD